MKKLFGLVTMAFMMLWLAVPCFAQDAPVEITVRTPPSKVTYEEGDKFDPTGMRLLVTTNAENGSEAFEIEAGNASLTYSPALDEKLKEGQTSVTVLCNYKNYTASASQAITVTAEGTGTVEGDPYISTYAATDKAGGELTTIRRGDRFTMVLRVVDNALASYDDVDESNVAARLNTAAFGYTGLAEVSQFDCGESEGKPYCSYVLIFRDVLYNGDGNTFAVDIGYTDTTRPVKSVSQTLGLCEDKDPAENARTPELIVRDVEYGGNSIAAGQSATLNLTLFATSGTESLSDVLVSLTLPEGVTLASGSQTSYVGSMSSGSTKTVSFQILPAATFTGGVANITANLSGVGSASSKAVSGSSTVSIPILQPERFEITKVEAPESIMLGEDGYISVTFVNKGKTAINNLSAEISGTNLANPGQNQFVGNIAAGTENSVDFDLVAQQSGTISGIVTLTYEDSQGATKTLTTNYSCMVEEMPAYDEMMDPSDMMPEEPAKTGLPIWAVALIVIVLAVVAVVVVRLVLKKRKAKALAALGDGDEDL